MRLRIPAFLTAAFLLVSVAHAHTHLEEATPADNSVLTSPPQQIALHFSEPTRITALTIQMDGDPARKPIEISNRQPAEHHAVPIAPLSPGKYTVTWRAIGADNHVMSGAMHFTIRGK